MICLHHCFRSLEKTKMSLPDHAAAEVKAFLMNFQSELCKDMEAVDKKATFFHDHWQRPEGGGGISCVMENGNLFEKAGVNFSHISGTSLPHAASKSRPELIGKAFEAMGVSIVIHPENPFLPTTHTNIRFFMTHDEHTAPVWWFGGGFDLTPYYAFEEDCVAWHQMAQKATHPFEDTLYPKWKNWCDAYFYLPHRQETRGIGGLFFDDFCEPDFETCFQILKNVGHGFWSAYKPIAEKRQNTPFNEQQKNFQRYRRGRYVEFNLLYDRGTLFGLQSQGRTESILMSMPPEVTFKYNWQPTQGSEEEKLYTRYLKPQNWL